METSQTNDLQSHHSEFLDAITQLTNSIAPVVSLIPGAAPFVVGAKALEALAGNVLDTIDNVKNAAQTVVNNSAGVSLPSNVDDVSNHVNLPENIDPATEAVAQIQQQQIPVDERITKIIADVEALRADVQPIIDEFQAVWGSVRGLLKQFGKA